MALAVRRSILKKSFLSLSACLLWVAFSSQRPWHSTPAAELPEHLPHRVMHAPVYRAPDVPDPDLPRTKLCAGLRASDLNGVAVRAFGTGHVRPPVPPDSPVSAGRPLLYFPCEQCILALELLLVGYM